MPAYITKIPVRFHEIDSAGIVYYPRFFDYFHLAFEDFFGAVTGTPYHVWIKDRRIGWPTVHIETDFASPLRYGMQVQVALWFPKLGRSSITTEYEARDAATGTLSCRCRLTSVTTDLEKMVSLPLPDEVRTVLERFTAP